MHLLSKWSCSLLHSCLKRDTSKTDFHTFRHILRWNIAGEGMLLVLDTWWQIVVLRRLVPSRVLMGRRMSHCWWFWVFQFFVNLLIDRGRQIFLETIYNQKLWKLNDIGCLPWLAVGRRWYRPLCNPPDPQLDGRQCLVGEGIAGEKKFK